MGQLLSSRGLDQGNKALRLINRDLENRGLENVQTLWETSHALIIESLQNSRNRSHCWRISAFSYSPG